MRKSESIGNSPTVDEQEATLPKLLKANSSKWGDRIWMRKKRSGLWREYTWAEGYRKVKNLTLALVESGFEPGDRLCIVGDSDPEWFWTEIAAQAAGGVAVGFGVDQSSEELQRIARDQDVKIIFARDQEQIDRVLEMKANLPGLTKLVYWDGKGMRHYADPILGAFDEIVEMGRSRGTTHPELFEDRLMKVNGRDPAFVHCGRGNGFGDRTTTLTHSDLLAGSRTFCAVDPIAISDEWFSSVMPEGTIEQVVGLVGSLTCGMTMNFPENFYTAQQDIRELGPSLVFYPANMWESLAGSVQDRIKKTTVTKRAIFDLFASTGEKLAEKKLKGERPGAALWLRGALAERVLFRPLRARLGLANTRRAYSSGKILSPVTLETLLGLGLDFRQLYVSGGMLVGQPLEVRPHPCKHHVKIA